MNGNGWMKILVTVGAAVLVTAFSSVLVHMRVLVAHETEMRDCRADVAECRNECRDSLNQERLRAIAMRIDELEGGPGDDAKTSLAVQELRATVKDVLDGMQKKPLEAKP